MKRKLPLFLVLLCAMNLAISQEKSEKISVYTSPDTKGFISIKKTDVTNDASITTTIDTKVNATFDDEVVNFTLSTTNDSDKMVAPSKLVFDGTMDATIKPVHFEGNRIKMDKKNASYWNFKGDFKDEAVTDPQLKPFFNEKYSSTLRFPERTIPTFNLWAIIPNLPFDRKGTFKFNSLDETKLYVSKNQTVNYLGKYKTPINGNVVELHKFVLQGKGMQPAYYWVNDDRELVQVLLDNKFTFTIDKDFDISQISVAETIN